MLVKPQNIFNKKKPKFHTQMLRMQMDNVN